MIHLFIGLMSGTSMDAIDAALVGFGPESTPPAILMAYSHPLPEELRQRLEVCCQEMPGCPLEVVAQLDVALGECFAEAAQALMYKAGIAGSEVCAIGSHGQTLYHAPEANPPYTVQIGDPNVIAARTGIAVVADWRRRDIAEGGQGAPLAPIFHQALFSDPKERRVIVNIGGIANLSVLSPGAPSSLLGWDTGPGNTLLDAWIQQHQGVRYDKDGEWARSGTPMAGLLAAWMRDPYWERPPPKSTGRDYFNGDWIVQWADIEGVKPVDVQASLTQLTAHTIAQAVLRYGGEAHTVGVCGGGAHNTTLMRYLKEALPDHAVDSTATLGVGPDWVEAAGFAWLAKARLDKQPVDLQTVTGSRRPVLLGGVYL